MPYLFDKKSKTILWQNISTITDLFKDIPSDANLENGVQMAFEINGLIYLTFKSDQNVCFKYCPYITKPICSKEVHMVHE